MQLTDNGWMLDQTTRWHTDGRRTGSWEIQCFPVASMRWIYGNPACYRNQFRFTFYLVYFMLERSGANCKPIQISPV